MAYGENATSLAFNRAFAALATNIDYIAGILDTPALRDDVLCPRDAVLATNAAGVNSAGFSGFYGLTGISGASINLAAAGTGSGVKQGGSPPTWVYVGLHKSALGEHIRAYRKQPTFIDDHDTLDIATFDPDASYSAGKPHEFAVGTMSYSPTGVSVLLGGVVKDYFSGVLDSGLTVNQVTQGSKRAGLPNWIPPVRPIETQLQPYGSAQQNLAIKEWHADGCVIGGDGHSLSDLYVRPGCFIRVTSSPADPNNPVRNNGLYRIAHVAKNSGTGLAGEGEKVILTRGGLHVVTVDAPEAEAGGTYDLSEGTRVSWNSRPDHASGAADDVELHAYIMHIIERPDLSAGAGLQKRDLYLATFGGTESLGSKANLDTYGTRSGLEDILSAVNAMNDIGLADQEYGADGNWMMPVGTVLHSNMTTETATVTACIPANYPVAFDTKVAQNGDALMCAPPGFVLNPTLTFDAIEPLIKGDYYLRCRSLTTVKERLQSASASVSPFAADDPTLRLGVTEADRTRADGYIRTLGTGPFVGDGPYPATSLVSTGAGAMAEISALAAYTDVRPPLPYTAALKILGSAIWQVTLKQADGAEVMDPITGQLLLADAQIGAGEAIIFENNPVDADIQAAGWVVAVDGNELTLFGGIRLFGENTTVPYADPIAPACKIIGASQPTGDGGVAYSNDWEVDSISVAPYVQAGPLSADNNWLYVPDRGLNAAYWSDYDIMGHMALGETLGNRIWMVQGKPLELMMPNGASDGQTGLSLRENLPTSRTRMIELKDRSGATAYASLNHERRLSSWVHTTPFTSSYEWGLTFRDSSSSNMVPIPLGSSENNTLIYEGAPAGSENNKTLGQVQDKSILGAIAGSIDGGVLDVLVLPLGPQTYAVQSTSLMYGAALVSVDSGNETFFIEQGAFLVNGTRWVTARHEFVWPVQGDWALSIEWGPNILNGDVDSPLTGSYNNDQQMGYRYVLEELPAGAGALTSDPVSPNKLLLHSFSIIAGPSLVTEGLARGGDFRRFTRRQDAKVDIYVGGKLSKADLVTGVDKRYQNFGRAIETSEFSYAASEVHCATLYHALNLIEACEHASNDSTEWSTVLTPEHNVPSGADAKDKHYTGRRYTIHVVSDTFESRRLTLPADGIHIVGHGSFHGGGVPYKYDQVTEYNNSANDWEVRGDDVTSPGLPKVTFGCFGGLINLAGYSCLIENVQFEWKTGANDAGGALVSGGTPLPCPNAGHNLEPDDSNTYQLDAEHFGAGNTNGINGRRQPKNSSVSKNLDNTVPGVVLFTSYDHDLTSKLHNVPAFWRESRDAGLGAGDWPTSPPARRLHGRQAGDLIIRNVGFVGGSGFLWLESWGTPSYRKIVVDHCYGKRLVDFGVYIAGGTGQRYAKANNANTAITADDVDSTFAHEPHESVEVTNCHFSQYGWTALYRADQDQPAIRKDTWCTDNYLLAGAIQVGCAKNILVENNVITAEMCWQRLGQVITQESYQYDHPDYAGLNFDVLEGEDLVPWFDAGYMDTAHTGVPIGGNQIWHRSIYRVVMMGTSVSNKETNTMYVAPARAETVTVTDPGATPYAKIHLPMGFTGRLPRHENTIGPVNAACVLNGVSVAFADEADCIAQNGVYLPEHTGAGASAAPEFPLWHPLNPHPDQGNPDLSDTEALRELFLGHFNFWANGIVVHTRPASYVYMSTHAPRLGSNADAANPSPDGTSEGAAPFMPTTSYTGKQHAIVRGNRIGFVYKRGISVTASTSRIEGNSFTAFAAGASLHDVDDLNADFENDVYAKQAIRVDSMHTHVVNNTYAPTFLGHNVEVDDDFLRYFVEHPGLGGIDPDINPVSVSGREIEVRADLYNRTGDWYDTHEQDATDGWGINGFPLGVTSPGQSGNMSSTLIAENSGFGIRTRNLPCTITSNNTWGGDISLYAMNGGPNHPTDDTSERALTTWITNSQSVAITGNSLSAPYISWAGSIYWTRFDESLVDPLTGMPGNSPTSAIVTSNNLQSTLRNNDGSIGAEYTFAYKDDGTCIVQNNLPPTLNDPGKSPLFTVDYALEPFIDTYVVGAIQPFHSAWDYTSTNLVSDVVDNSPYHFSSNVDHPSHTSAKIPMADEGNGWFDIHPNSSDMQGPFEGVYSQRYGPTVPSMFSGWTGPIHTEGSWSWTDDGGNTIHEFLKRVSRGATGNAAGLPADADAAQAPSMWLFGNSFPDGGGLTGGGACHHANFTRDHMCSNFGSDTANPSAAGGLAPGFDFNTAPPFGQYYTIDQTGVFYGSDRVVGGGEWSGTTWTQAPLNDWEYAHWYWTDNAVGNGHGQGNDELEIAHLYRYFERRPFWGITKIPAFWSPSRTPVAQIFTTSLKPSDPGHLQIAGRTRRLNKIFLDLKIVKQRRPDLSIKDVLGPDLHGESSPIAEDPNLSYGHLVNNTGSDSWPLPKNGDGTGGNPANDADAEEMVPTDATASYASPGSYHDIDTMAVGVQAFINRDGKRTQVGQWITHSASDAAVDAGCHLEELTHSGIFNSHCHETGNLVKMLSWGHEGNGQIAKKWDGVTGHFDEPNYATRMVFHGRMKPGAGSTYVSAAPAGMAEPNPRTAGIESSWGDDYYASTTDGTAAKAEYLSTTPTQPTAGPEFFNDPVTGLPTVPNPDYENHKLASDYNDGFITVPLSTRMMEDNTTAVNRDIGYADTIELVWYLWAAPANHALMDIRVHKIQVEYTIVEPLG